MSATALPGAAVRLLPPSEHTARVGPIGRLGRYTATHLRTVLIGWLLVALVLGFFAPRVEKALSGAGWEASGSQSVQARKLVERNFAGLGSYGLMTVLYSPTQTVNSPAFRSTIARVEQTLRANAAVRTVVSPAPRLSISRDGHTAIVQAGAARNPNEMVAAAEVMVAVFFTFALSGPLPPKEMGIILGVAVLLDATLIRLLLLPVLLRLMGARAWYLPRWARRILPDVRFGHS